MLYVTLNDGKEAGILFRHERTQVGDQQHPFRTTCSIFVEEEAIGTGIAKVDSRDQFDYDKGRTFALKHALNAAGFDKAARTQVWQQYRDR